MKISHEPRCQRFTLRLEDNQLAYIDYQIRSGVVYLMYAQVPIMHRGQGIGRILVSETVAYLKSKDIGYFPICGYIKSVLNQNVPGE